MDIKVLFEDTVILAVVKPQGMPSQADKTGDPDLLSQLEAYAKQPLGLLHRLDRPVGGVMLFAKTKSAESVLSKNLQEGSLHKTYLAVLCGRLPKDEDTLTDFLRKNTRTNLSEVVMEKEKGAKQAVLHYRRIAEKVTEFGWLTLAEINLMTGRHHQIRVQTSHAGVPIWGDRKYHKTFRQKGKTDIALWSWKLEGIHPVTKESYCFTAKPEKEPFSYFAEEFMEM